MLHCHSPSCLLGLLPLPCAYPVVQGELGALSVLWEKLGLALMCPQL